MNSLQLPSVRDYFSWRLIVFSSNLFSRIDENIILLDWFWLQPEN